MSSIPSFKLNTGASIPGIGLGTWAGFTQEERDGAKDWIISALKAGYRRIDTAWLYGTEKVVGQAIKESGVPREEIFLSTKLPWHHPGREEQSIQESLDNLGVDYVDLYLLHWPMTLVYEDNNAFPMDIDGQLKLADGPPFQQTWAAMEKIHASGRAKAIGVSNFSVKTLEELLATAKVIPADNQVELHPLLIQEELRIYCQSKGMCLTAYAATGYKTVLEHPVIVELADKYKVTSAQVVLAWHLARGISVVPKSADAQRQKDNINLPTLDPEDVERISGCDRNQRLCNVPNEKGIMYGWTVDKLGW